MNGLEKPAGCGIPAEPHAEDEEGRIISFEELSGSDLAAIRSASSDDVPGTGEDSVPPQEAVCAKIGGRWHEITGVGPDGMSVTRELHGTDALYLEAASQIDTMSAILLVLNDGAFGNKKPRPDIMRKFSESARMFSIIAGGSGA